MSKFDIETSPNSTLPTATRASLVAEHTRRAARQELQRRHVLEFARGFSNFEFVTDTFHKELSAILDKFRADVEAGRSPRIIISAPPQVGKTNLIVHSFAPYLLGMHPEWDVIVATYSQDRADDHGREIRARMSSPDFANLFPTVGLDPAKRSVSNIGLVNPKSNRAHKGAYLGAGISGGITGHSCNVFIGDDLIKNLEEARSPGTTQKIFDEYQASVLTRMQPGGGIILLATRWTETDPSGLILDSAMGEDYEYYAFPAFNEEDQPLVKAREADWRKLRKSMDAKTWSAMYMCEPICEEGAIYSAADLQSNVGKAPPLSQLRTYISTDPAASSKETSDYWAALVFGLDKDDNMWVLDKYHARGIDSLTYVDALFDLCAKYKPSKVFMERCHASNVLQPVIDKHMRETRTYYNFEYPTTGNKDKVSRSASSAARVKQGKVKFSSELSAFLPTLFRELASFPDGKNDDLQDCLAQVINQMGKTILPYIKPPEAVTERDNGKAAYFEKRRAAKSPDYEGIARQPRKLY